MAFIGFAAAEILAAEIAAANIEAAIVGVEAELLAEEAALALEEITVQAEAIEASMIGLDALTEGGEAAELFGAENIEMIDFASDTFSEAGADIFNDAIRNGPFARIPGAIVRNGRTLGIGLGISGAAGGVGYGLYRALIAGGHEYPQTFNTPFNGNIANVMKRRSLTRTQSKREKRKKKLFTNVRLIKNDLQRVSRRELLAAKNGCITRELSEGFKRRFAYLASIKRLRDIKLPKKLACTLIQIAISKKYDVDMSSALDIMRKFM